MGASASRFGWMRWYSPDFAFFFPKFFGEEQPVQTSTVLYLKRVTNCVFGCDWHLLILGSSVSRPRRESDGCECILPRQFARTSGGFSCFFFSIPFF